MNKETVCILQIQLIQRTAWISDLKMTTSTPSFEFHQFNQCFSEDIHLTFVNVLYVTLKSCKERAEPDFEALPKKPVLQIILRRDALPTATKWSEKSWEW